MKNNIFLVLVTILFVITGSLLLFSTLNEYGFGGGEEVCVVDGVEYKKGEEIVGYRTGHKCTCGSSGLVECIPLSESEELQKESAIDVSDWAKDGLDFNYSYIVGISDDDVDFNTSVKFQDVRFEEEGLLIILEQYQSCLESGTPPEQVGFYNEGSENLSLYNMIRRVDDEETIGCLVRLEYTFEEIDYVDLKNVELRFIDNLGVVTSPNVCLYNDRVYFEGDFFEGEDKEVCVCEDGVVDCE